ncbi:MFS transporter [Mongoliimonas terrestris]|uniref:MFS transporter n=1 Tax=Mongoliimonas terrestris TaxID=1709001 RepID=UPI000ADA8AE9|nr:MFS transporter [Mongoliimonas terrestris]
MSQPYADRRGVIGWILFDPATQPFFTLITTFVFAPYFAAAVAPTPAAGQALWGYATAAAGLTIALTAPMLGAIADETGRRKPFIALFGGLMALASAGLWLVEPGRADLVPLALVLFALGTIGAEYAIIFNNAMMTRIVPPERLGRLSGTGWAAGFAGGLLSLVFVLGFLAADPETGRTLVGLEPLFGLDPAAREGDRAAGPLTALWFAVLVLPLLLFTPDGRGGTGVPILAAVRGAFASLKETLSRLKHRPGMGRFLIANMIYTDGLVALFAFGGVYAAGTFGWGTIEIGLFGILLTITGTVGAFVGGRLDDRFGSKRVVLGALALLTACSIAILTVDATHIFLVVETVGPAPGDGLYATWPERVYMVFGALIGLAVGPVQAASRTLLCRLAPEGETGRFFGLFALTGKITSFAGPLLVGIATDLTDSQRMGVVPLVVFFLVGAFLLSGVRVPAR